MVVTLKNEKCTIKCQQEGAMLHSLVKDDIEYLWQGDKSYWGGQAPVCFPIVGVLKNGAAKAFGKECSMARHGVARINPFEIKEQGANFVTFVQISTEETKKQFPFDYRLEIKYTLNGDTVTTEYTVLNIGDSSLPFAIGGHPAFNCPLCDDEAFEDYSVKFDKVLTKKCLRPDDILGLLILQSVLMFLKIRMKLKCHTVFLLMMQWFLMICSLNVRCWQAKTAGVLK